ncbi:MAG: hypothetical protein SGPRY_009294 [Prymnesium sp.]
MASLLLPLASAQQTAGQLRPEARAQVIGGQGAFRYRYLPHLLLPPAGAAMVNCHGLVVDADGNIYLTYENDGVDANCLIKWRADGTDGRFLSPSDLSSLCSGVPHGLTISDEEGVQYLYHANNQQTLTKTTLEGEIVWQRTGYFGQPSSQLYRPTWFAVPPGRRMIYLCDGYGSNHVYVFDRTDGSFMNRTYGGKGGRDQHGDFSTNHGCTWDPRNDKIAISDRANSRIEYFDFNDHGRWSYSHTVDMRPVMGSQTLPCNLRAYPEQHGHAVSPDLTGPVAVLDKINTVVSVVNVSSLLAV